MKGVGALAHPMYRHISAPEHNQRRAVARTSAAIVAMCESQCKCGVLDWMGSTGDGEGIRFLGSRGPRSGVRGGAAPSPDWGAQWRDVPPQLGGRFWVRGDPFP